MEEKNKKIKKVTIEPGCIACGTCQVLCPEVFEIDQISQVKAGADLDAHASVIREAAEICPVGVIVIEDE